MLLDDTAATAAVADYISLNINWP